MKFKTGIIVVAGIAAGVAVGLVVYSASKDKSFRNSASKEIDNIKTSIYKIKDIVDKKSAISKEKTKNSIKDNKERVLSSWANL